MSIKLQNIYYECCHLMLKIEWGDCGFGTLYVGGIYARLGCNGNGVAVDGARCEELGGVVVRDVRVVIGFTVSEGKVLSFETCGFRKVVRTTLVPAWA